MDIVVRLRNNWKVKTCHCSEPEIVHMLLRFFKNWNWRWILLHNGTDWSHCLEVHHFSEYLHPFLVLTDLNIQDELAELQDAELAQHVTEMHERCETTWRTYWVHF